MVFDRGEPEQREEGGHVYEVIDSRGRSVATTKAEEVSQQTHTHTHTHTYTHKSRKAVTH